MCLEMSLHILLNCVLNKKIMPAFNFADSTTVLIPLANCTHLGVRIKAKSILSFLSCYVRDEDMKVMQLDAEEVTFIVQSLPCDADSSSDAPDIDCWLQILRNFSKYKENIALLSINEVFQLISNILIQGVESAQEFILQLLWELSSSEAAKKKINDQHSDIVEVLERLGSQSSDLQILALCVLWHLKECNPTGRLCAICIPLQHSIIPHRTYAILHLPLVTY